MTQTDTYKAAIAAWVAGQIGPSVTVAWRDEPQNWLQKPRVQLHLHTTKSIGVDVVAYAQDMNLPAGADFVPTYSGVREITLSILAESRDQHLQAWEILETLRLSLRKRGVRGTRADGQGLYAAGLAYSTVEAVHDLSSVVEGRVESSASMDVHFNTVLQTTDANQADSYVDSFAAPLPTWNG